MFFLAQVEAQVKHKDPQKAKSKANKDDSNTQSTQPQNGVPQIITEVMEPLDLQSGMQYSLPEASIDPMVTAEPLQMPPTNVISDLNGDMLNVTDSGLGLGDDFSWEMIGLGLEEPMPTQEAIDELYTIPLA